MRRLLKQLSDHLQAFIAGRDQVALVLRSPAADALPMLKILEGLEETSASDLFWTFTEPFTGAADYATTVIKAFTTKHRATQLAMEKEGLRPWPPIPPSLLAEQGPAAQRLRGLAAFSRELLPVPHG